MPDWPTQQWSPPSAVITIASRPGPLSVFFAEMNAACVTNTAWPAQFRALYCPVVVESTVTVYQMSYIVGTQSGNYDIGIYDEFGTRLVSTGSTAVPAAGLAVANITDTTLTPGVYFLALNMDNATVAVTMSTGMAAEILRSAGVQQQLFANVTLGATATFANPASAYLPWIAAHCYSTTV